MLPIAKLESLKDRFSELEEMICRPDIVADSTRYTKLIRERGDLEEIVRAYSRYATVQREIKEHKNAMNDTDLRALAEAEIPALEKESADLEAAINLLLLPRDPNDERDTIIEIRSGTGGEEAALFAAELFRMYGRYAEKQGWKIEISSISHASAGGLKEVVATISGKRVYSVMRFEGGVHRVQRVPQTEAQGRVHTSTATVAVMPEPDEIADDMHIDAKDLEITATASGGPGGQGVNTTNSAVQIKHIPTGIYVRSEEQRSQHQNKESALQILKAKHLDAQRQQQSDQIHSERRSMVGSGDRSEKIRTYNFPQNRLTDHRIGLTVHNLDRVIEGELDDVVLALRNHYQAELLTDQSKT